MGRFAILWSGGEVLASWRMDETYIKVKGGWKYLYRAVDEAGDPIDFLLRARRDKVAARTLSNRLSSGTVPPEKVTIDKSGAGADRRPPDQVPEQHRRAGRRAVKRRTRPMLDFKDLRSVRILLFGIELMHMIRKGQMKDGGKGQTPAQHFYALVA
jgi:putative transposase